MLWDSFNLADKLIFIIVLAITIILSVIGRFYKKICKNDSITTTNNELDFINKKDVSFVEYWFMGRQLTLPFFVATLVSTWYGGIFGVTQIAFEHGIHNFITQGVFWYIGYVIFAFFLAEKIHLSKALSLPEIASKMFGPKSARIVAFVLLVKTLPISYAISIGIFIKIFFGLKLTEGIIIACFLVALFSYIGGFRGVVLRDAWQFFLMYFGVISVVVFSITNYGGFTYLHNKLPQEYFSVNGYHDTGTTVLWLIVALNSILISPVFYQRCIAAKNPHTAKIGILISALFWLFFDICTTLGGMYAKAAIPNADPVDAYLIYSIDLLPSGYKGIFIGGVLATILSTLDAFLFASGAIINYDLFKAYKLNRGLGIIIASVLTTFIALCFDGRIEDLWLYIESYCGMIIALPLLLKVLVPQKFIIKDWQFVFYSLLFLILKCLSKYLLTDLYIMNNELNFIIINLIILFIFSCFNYTILIKNN